MRYKGELCHTHSFFLHPFPVFNGKSTFRKLQKIKRDSAYTLLQVNQPWYLPARRIVGSYICCEMLILCEFTNSTQLHLRLHRRTARTCFATLRNKVSRQMWEPRRECCGVASMDDASSSNTEHTRRLQACLYENEDKGGRPGAYEISRQPSREQNERCCTSSLRGSLWNAHKSALANTS